MKRILILIIGFALLSSLAYTDSSDDGWPRWRGKNGDGISNETNWNPILERGAGILWKVEIGSGYSNVVIQNDRLYTMGYGDGPSLYCLDAATGQEIWKYVFTGYVEPQSTPCVDGDSVYGLNADGVLVCLNTKNGEHRWEKNIEKDLNAKIRTRGGWATSPVVEGDLLLINANTMGYALDKKSGDTVWRIEDASGPSNSWGSYATPVVCDIGDVRCALFLGPGSLNVVEVTTGDILWSYRHDDIYHPAADPTFIGDNAIFCLCQIHALL